MTPAFVVFALALMGLTIGSFLNVVIHRVPRGESIVFPASRCPSCKAALRWYHNIPVLSWIALRGRCAFCRTNIPIRYPLVELLTGVVFALHGWLLGVDALLVVRLGLAAALIALAFIDLDHRILPNVVTLPGIAVGVACSLFLPPGWTSSLVGVALGGGVLWAIGELYFRLRRVEGMGMGDVKMLAMIGAFLGWRAVVVTLVLASISGALVGVVLLTRRENGMGYALPFGTFLAAGALASSLVGERLVTWYLSFYPA
jgi:leader peptidase (prepilin peptidase)/N-methyltransferase